MTRKTLIVLVAIVVTGIGTVTLVVDQRPPPTADRTAVPADIEGDAAGRAMANSTPPSHSALKPVASGTRQIAGAGRTFGEAVIFEIGFVCDDAGACSYRPAPRHEYATYTNGQLETIAAYDGAAAIVLANRLGSTDTEAARRWAVRGFLLTGDPYAYHMASLYSGVHVGATFTANGDLDTKAAEEAYIWLSVGHELGVADAVTVSEQARILETFRAFDRDRLDAEIESRLSSLIEERVNLTGRTF